MRASTTLLLLVLLGLFQHISSFHIYGVDYGIKRGDGSCPTYEQVLADMKIMKTFTNRVRIYSTCDCYGFAGDLTIRAAKEVGGMQVFLGVQPAPEDIFAAEKFAIQALHDSKNLDIVIGIAVGSEALYREEFTSEQLAAKINDIKYLVQQTLSVNIPVTTVDVYYKLDDILIASMDIILMNTFPCWEGVAVENAVETMWGYIAQVKAKANGKPVIIGETGWPSAGDVKKEAVPSMENMQRFFSEFICRAEEENIPYYWFEAFDERWKEVGFEQNFGLYTDDRQRKEGSRLDCQTDDGEKLTSSASFNSLSIVLTSVVASMLVKL